MPLWQQWYTICLVTLPRHKTLRLIPLKAPSAYYLNQPSQKLFLIVLPISDRQYPMPSIIGPYQMEVTRLILILLHQIIFLPQGPACGFRKPDNSRNFHTGATTGRLSKAMQSVRNHHSYHLHILLIPAVPFTRKKQRFIM